MKDKLERFVSENREQFDSETPKERVWKRIMRDLSRKQSSTGFWMWKAAAIIFFGLSAFLFLKDVMEEPAKVQSTELISDEFEEAEVYYTSLISMKEEEIENYSSEGDYDYNRPTITPRLNPRVNRSLSWEIQSSLEREHSHFDIRRFSWRWRLSVP